MEPKKILITGGLWYIGSHTAALFSQAGYDIVLLDNLSNTHKDEVLSSLKILTNKDLPFYEGDVRDYDFLDNHQLALAVGAAFNKSCYNGYDHGFGVCNIEFKYTYSLTMKNFTLPLSVAFITNPVYNKSHVNFKASFVF